MFWHVSIHQSVCPHLGGEVPQLPESSQGVPLPGGYPPVRPGQGVYPCQGGTPPQVPSHWTWPGVPLLGEYPTLGTPPLNLAGGYPSWGGYPTSGGVLDTLWSVCLLRSRRRTFLFTSVIIGRSRGGARDTHPFFWARISSFSVFGKIGQIIGWRPLGSSGSVTCQSIDTVVKLSVESYTCSGGSFIVFYCMRFLR